MYIRRYARRLLTGKTVRIVGFCVSVARALNSKNDIIGDNLGKEVNTKELFFQITVLTCVLLHFWGLLNCVTEKINSCDGAKTPARTPEIISILMICLSKF